MTISTIHFSRQGKIIRRPNFNLNNNANSNVNSNISNVKKRASFNCGSESHIVKQYPYTIIFSLAAANCIRNLRSKNAKNAVHIVLAHLCCELNDVNSEFVDNDDPALDDAVIFDKMLVNNDEINSYSHTGDDKELYNVKILAVRINLTPTTDEFWGACIDSGAHCTVIGLKKANSYKEIVRKNFILKHKSTDNSKRCRFGNTEHICLGMLKLRLPVSSYIVITFDEHIAPINIPLLFRVDVLRQLRIIINIDHGSLIIIEDKWRMPLVYKIGFEKTTPPLVSSDE